MRLTDHQLLTTTDTEESTLFSWNLGAGLELGLLEERHADELFALTEANREMLREWLPWVDWTGSAADSASFIRNVLHQFAEGRGVQTGIWVAGRLAGMIGYHPINWANRSVEIGYWLGATYQSRGFMTRACRALVDHAFRDLGLNRVEIRAATGNARSRAVPERLGFVHEGTIRQAEWLYDHFVDHAVYGMLAEDWNVKRET